MKERLKFGIQSNGIRHRHEDGMPDIDSRFAMVREAGIFDYVDKTPDPHEVDDFLAASEKYQLPVLGGGWFYVLGQDEPLLANNLALAGRLGSVVHNIQVLTNHADGHPVSNEEVVDFYEQALELAAPHRVQPCLEVHVNMWSEDFRRVSEVGGLAEARGLPFAMTLDHSHVIFKIDHPGEQEVSGIREDVAAGRLVLDPFQANHVCGQWIRANWVQHCHARSAIPNNPRNIDASDADGDPGRGIQYPFVEPAAGAYHGDWQESALEPWKEVIRQLLAHHASNPNSPLGQISTEFIPNLDYGEGCRYSLFEQAIGCVEWMRAAWAEIAADTAQHPPNSSDRAL